MRFDIRRLGRKCLGLLVLACLAGVSSAFAAYQVPGDSVGSEQVDGQVFVLYKVEPKETLYSISNRYNISVAELVNHNPETEAGLKIGTVLRIPYKESAEKEDGYHRVVNFETLYSIGRQYGVSVAELKEWNNLPSDAITLGARLRVSPPENLPLNRPNANTAAVSADSNVDPMNYAGKIVHTVEPKETLFSIARMHDTTEEKIKEWNRLSTNNLAIGQKLIVGTAQGIPSRSQEGERMLRNGEEEARPTDYTYNKNPVAITQIGDPSQEDLKEKEEISAVDVRKMTELGLAMVIDDTASTKKYLALHRTAPIGTIMQVHNEMNNLSVFVRVVGKLPATGDNDKVLIKLSRKAFEKLGAYNEKFPVRLTYVP